MRYSRVLVLALLAGAFLAAGCKSKNKGKIEGTKWTSQAQMIGGNLVPVGAVSLEFGTDGSLVYTIGLERLTGKYTLGFGDTVTLHFDKEVEGFKKHREKIVIEGDTLTMIDGDGTSLKLNRAK